MRILILKVIQVYPNPGKNWIFFNIYVSNLTLHNYRKMIQTILLNSFQTESIGIDFIFIFNFYFLHNDPIGLFSDKRHITDCGTYYYNFLFSL